MLPLDTTIPITFTLDDDAHASKVEAVLFALGYAPTRVDSSGAPVGLTVEQLTVRYSLSSREVLVVQAMLCGAVTTPEIAAALRVDVRTATWVRRALSTKTKHATAGKPVLSLLRRLPPGYTISTAPDSDRMCLRLHDEVIALECLSAGLAALAWRAFYATPETVGSVA